jgi:hypothetical protein
MNHLTDAEFVDCLDGTLAPARAAHVSGCERCRDTVDDLRNGVARAAEDDVPEPSPLFWEHFSARVHDAVREADASATSGWFGWARSTTGKWAMSGAALTLALVAGIWLAAQPTPRTPAHVPAIATNAREAIAVAQPDAFDAAFDPDADEAWSLVRTVADDVTWDDATSDGFGLRPGSTERALVTLTGDERSELARLLQAETRQPGA